MGISLPRVTVVVPCFNETPDRVFESLSSVSNQTFSDFECIVIDESTDPERAGACREFCKKDYRFRYVHPSERLGLAGSLNLGFAMALGEFVARFDSDDICVPSRLEQQVLYLDTNPKVGVVGSWVQVISGAGAELAVRRYPSASEDIVRKFIYTNAMAHPTVMIRKSVLGELSGPYRPDYKFSEDLELWLRLLSAGVCFANIPECLVLYRQDATHRPLSNWKYNIKARLLHLSSPYWFLKVGAIVLLAFWAYAPAFLRNFIYRKIILN